MDLTLGAVLRRGLLAGLAAGVAAALVALFVVEPVIRDALVVEEARAAAEPAGAHEEELVTRTTQVIGGMLAAVVVALCLAVVLAVVFAAVRHRLPGGTDFGRLGALAAYGFVTVALLPGVKYPANPPAVGDPDTVTTRTLQYFSLIAAAIAVTWLAFAVRNALRRRDWPAPRAVVVSTIAAVTGYVLLLVLWPANPDPIPADIASLLWRFRLASLAELAALWGTLGLTMGLLLTTRRTPATPATAAT
ncbi:MAG: hypothetical protein GEV12_18745 [Micromonosporaceae bacterium]|nr:hypothetical protein [Micromonosporaceae bacterium]